MAVKRHFSGKPVGEEYGDSSSDEGLESEKEEEQVQRQQKNIKTSINIRPIEKEVKEVPRDDKYNGVADNQIQAADKSTNNDTEENEIEKEPESESESESEESDSDEDSDSDSDDEPKLLKPIFLSKSQRAQTKKIASSQDKAERDKERTLKTIESHINQDIEERKKLKESEINLGGIDDTDDLDPELERAQWELRQLKREERDRAKLEQEQDEYEELENRRLRTEEERLKEYEDKLKEEGNEEKQKVKGAYFREEALLKRDLGEENEKYDKSLLPQKYDPKAHK